MTLKFSQPYKHFSYIFYFHFNMFWIFTSTLRFCYFVKTFFLSICDKLYLVEVRHHLSVVGLGPVLKKVLNFSCSVTVLYPWPTRTLPSQLFCLVGALMRSGSCCFKVSQACWFLFVCVNDLVLYIFPARYVDNFLV